ncbi:FAR1-related sequence 5-like protein, partial [Tanacetum coccineum]
IHYVKDADSDICEEIELSDGTFNYKPLVDESEKPKIGSEYPTIDKCIEMYAKYAEKSGFTIRKSTQEKLKSGIPSRKYLLCNKEGLPNGVNKDTMSEETSENRSGSIIRTGCLARAKFKINVTHTAYVLYEFEEAHNHTFVPKAYRNLTKKRKQMTHPEQIFVQQLGITSIGATRAHHLYASTHGGYELVNSTETEYRNHKRDLNTHIGDSDAQMLITKLTNRKQHVDNFSFEYNMVFVPFTGIDNHRKCVTFGAGMLSNETTLSYKWLLTCFLKAFKKQPRLVVTDEDPAMRNAIASVFNESTHRLCMWHITNKLPLKICSKVLDNGTFRRRLHHLVWSLYIDPDEFEEKWHLLIERYAQKKYTKTMFTLIQEEINAAVYDCHQISEILENGIETVTIKEIRDIKVSTDKSDGSVLCSCMNFARFGFLCRHIFCVLKGNGVEVIPDKYILKRWTRDILPPHIRRKKQMFGFEGGRYMECSTTVYSAIKSCLNLLAKNEEKLVEFVENIKRLKTEVEERNPNAKPLSK